MVIATGFISKPQGNVKFFQKHETIYEQTVVSRDYLPNDLEIIYLKIYNKNGKKRQKYNESMIVS